MLITLVLLLISTQSAYAFITVANGGVGAGCDFQNLEDAYNLAIANNDREIRVATDLVVLGGFTIASNITIKGGYADCAAANADIVGSNLSQWSGENNTTVVDINIASGADSVVIENFRIYDGRNIFFAGAGGIFIHGNSQVTLDNVTIDHNTGNEGGGVRVTGGHAYVTLIESKVKLNSAESGAGVYCEDGAILEVFNNSFIKGNNATNKGGGIFGNLNCSINITSGSIASESDATAGIYFNQANFGAGLYLQGGAHLMLQGDTLHPASIDFNIAATSGGAIYMKDNTTWVVALNTKIINNQAGLYGGAITALNHAVFLMNRSNISCWNNDECSNISNNNVNSTVGSAAVAYVASNAFVKISQTKIDANRAHIATLFDINNAQVILEGNLITHNKSFNTTPTNKSENLFVLRDSSSLEFYYNTLTENSSYAIYKIYLATVQTLNIYNSIIWDAGDILTEFDNSGAALPVQSNILFGCNSVHETASLSAALSLSFTGIVDPQFVDVANNNYHLSSISGSISGMIDRCNEDTIQSTHADLNGNARGFDIATLSNFDGPYDAGAYEFHDTPVDIIFKDGFEN